MARETRGSFLLFSGRPNFSFRRIYFLENLMVWAKRIGPRQQAGQTLAEQKGGPYSEGLSSRSRILTILQLMQLTSS